MQPLLPRLWLALSLGILSAACSQDTTNPTDPTAAAGAELKPAADKEAATYAVIGDVPYTTLADFTRLIAGINQDPAVTRVVHVGDIKSGSTVCSDSWFSSIATAFTTFTDPLVYTPGDNEWTDCHRANNGGFNPLERLAKVRQLFFAQPGLTLGGQHLPVEFQDGFPENQRWVASDVVFSALHIVGSNNDLAPWFTDRASGGETVAEAAAQEAEWRARNDANIAWLEQTFAEARDQHAQGVVLFFQADMWNQVDRDAGLSFTGHTAFVQRLAELAARFKRPVLLIAGDSHDLRVDTGVPWFSLYGTTPPSNVTQIIVDRSIDPGEDIDYLRLRIDPKSKDVFSWEQVILGPII